MEGHKAEKLFSLIYGLSLTIMKDIQGVFWGCPRIEALFWPGLGGYVTALTGSLKEAGAERIAANPQALLAMLEAL